MITLPVFESVEAPVVILNDPEVEEEAALLILVVPDISVDEAPDKMSTRPPCRSEIPPDRLLDPPVADNVSPGCKVMDPALSSTELPVWIKTAPDPPAIEVPGVHGA